MMASFLPFRACKCVLRHGTEFQQLKVAHMIPVRFMVVGEEDYAVDVDIRENGEFRLSGGTYTSQPPRSGRLTEAQEAELLAAIEAITAPGEQPKPAEADAFEATLTVGAQGEAKTYRFWEGALEQNASLKRLVRLLETL